MGSTAPPERGNASEISWFKQRTDIPRARVRRCVVVGDFFVKELARKEALEGRDRPEPEYRSREISDRALVLRSGTVAAVRSSSWPGGFSWLS